MQRLGGRAVFTVRVVQHALFIVVGGEAVQLSAVLVQWTGSIGGVPAVAGEGVFALHLVVHARHVVRVVAANALQFCSHYL